jgi:hypothetical protein
MKEDNNSPQNSASTSLTALEYGVSRTSSLVVWLDTGTSSTPTLSPPNPRADSGPPYPAAPQLESRNASAEVLNHNAIYLYPYSRPEAQRALTVLVIITIILAALISITLSAAELTRFMAVPSVVPAVILFAEKIIGHTRFILHIIREARELKKGDWMTPAGGTRAPAPSLFEDHGV